MLKRMPLGDMAPDMPPGGQLNLASNVSATPNGYQPVKALQALTPALPGFQGGAAFVGPNGSTGFLAGDSTDLYNYTGSAWSSVLAQAGGKWRFGQFGDNVICVNGGPLVSYSISGGAAALTGGNPPDSDLVAIVRDFVMVAGNPTNRLTATWSGFNDSGEWTNGTSQSGAQEMLDGGEIMGLAGGEYGLILQRNGIRRADYVGPPLVFQFSKVSEEIGCMAKGSVAQAGRRVFFISERGFMTTVGAEPEPIGNEKIDRAFFSRYNRQTIENVSATIDPRRHEVCWAMPDRIWKYNWTLDKWSVIDLPNLGVFSGFTADTSTDALPWANTDAGTEQLDSPIFQGGDPLFLVADTSGVVGTLTGETLRATFVIPPYEFMPSKVRMRTLRPVSNATNVSVTLDVKERSGDSERKHTSKAVRRNGDLPLRARGRHFTTTITVPAGETWTYFQALDFIYESGGSHGGTHAS